MEREQLQIKNFTDFVRLVLKADGPEREFKSVPILYTAPGSRGTKAADAGNAVSDERVVDGIVAVHGNIDDDADRSYPGCFAKTLSEGRVRVRHLWNHMMSQPPTAAILDLKEVTAAELPAAVKEFAPEATGGLFISRKYLKTGRGDEILEGIAAGAIDEMSYAYSAIKYDFETVNAGLINELRIRNLREVRLWDTSDVLWGCNPATLADAAAALEAGKNLPFEARVKAVLTGLQDLHSQLKEGRRNSDADAALIKQIHTLAVQLEPTCCAGSEQGGKSAGDQQDEQSRAAAEQQKAAQADALTLAGHAVALAQFESLLSNC